MVKVGKRLLTSLYLDPRQKDALAELSKRTRVPASVYLREAVDDMLAKYARELKRKEIKS